MVFYYFDVEKLVQPLLQSDDLKQQEQGLKIVGSLFMNENPKII